MWENPLVPIWFAPIKDCPTEALSGLSSSMGIHRSSASRGLKILEETGLVDGDRSPGRVPIVTILEGR